MTQAYQVAVPWLAEADKEARELGHSFLAPEHLLIAVAAHDDGDSRSFLEGIGLPAATIRRAVVELVGPTPQSVGATVPLTLSLRSQLALAAAIRIARARGERDAPYCASDLLLALLEDEVAETGVVGAIIKRAGLSHQAARVQFRGSTG